MIKSKRLCQNLCKKQNKNKKCWIGQVKRPIARFTSIGRLVYWYIGRFQMTETNYLLLKINFL